VDTVVMRGYDARRQDLISLRGSATTPLLLLCYVVWLHECKCVHVWVVGDGWVQMDLWLGKGWAKCWAKDTTILIDQFFIPVLYINSDKCW